MIIDIEQKIIGKVKGYERWVTNFNLKSMSKTLLFLRDNKIESIEYSKMKSNKATEKFNALSTGIKEKETRMAELLEFKKHIANYPDTREIHISIGGMATVKSFSRNIENRLNFIKQLRKHLMNVDSRSFIQQNI